MADPRLDLGQQIFGFFKQKGLPDYQAAAVAGNMAWEGGGRTDLVNPWDNKKVFNSPHSFGIAQWNDRLPGLIDYARKSGANIPQGDLRDVNYLKSIAPQLPLNTQLEYAWQEMQGPEKRAFDTLRGGTDLRSANAGAISYHRPAGWSWGNPMGGHGFQGRMSLADQIMRLGASDLPAPPPTADSANTPTSPPENKMASNPFATGAIPTATGPMSQDPTTGQWTPDEVIKQQFNLAGRFMNQPEAKGPLGALAQGLGGLFGGMQYGGAQQSIRDNQDLQSRAIRDAMNLPDLKSQAQAMMRSGVPALEMKGAQTLEQLGLKRAEQEERFNTVNRMLGGNFGAAPQPQSPAANAAVPSSGPPLPGTGVAPGAQQPPNTPLLPQAQPSATAPAPRTSNLDKRTLGIMVAAGLIPAEAAKLLQEDRSFEDSFDKHSGEAYAKAYQGYRESLPKLNNMLGSYSVLEALIKNPATIQGLGAGPRKQFDRTMEAIGIRTEGLAPTQVMEALSNELTLQMRSAAGGMPGAMSDKDLGFLQAMTANTANNPEANLFLVQMRKRVMQREQDVAKLALRYAQQNNGRLDHRFDGLLQEYAEKNPLWSDKEMKALSGQRETTVKPDVAQAQQPPQAATKPAATTPEHFAQMPVGSVVNGMRKVADGRWEPEAAAPQSPQRPQETPVERAARKRAENARQQAEAPGKAAAEAARVQSEFETDAGVMQPLDMARKYDSMRSHLTPTQLVALNDLILKATGR